MNPGAWHFRQSVDYSQTANRAVLDYASRNREHLLFNIWRMGANSIDRGSRDSWTVLPKWIDRVAEEVGPRGSLGDYEAHLRDPANRDARGYILPSDQRGFATATRFVNALLKNGVTVHRATDDFAVAGKDYPVGSYVVTTAQAFRPQVIDMFEPQNHPNDFQYPGGPPIAPYDNAGWTLALQMGVEFDRVLDEFSGPFEPIAWLADPIPGTVAGAESPAGYMVDHVNAAFTAVNRVLAGGGQAFWVEDSFDEAGVSFAPGAFFIPAAAATRAELEGWAAQLGVAFHGVAAAPEAAFELTHARVGLWDRYGGSMPSGWTRHVLEDFEFNFEVIYPPDIDAGGLNERFDVIVLPDGALGFGRGFGRFDGPDEDFLTSLPDSLRGRLGSLTAETSTPALREFIENGGGHRRGRHIHAAGSAARPPAHQLPRGRGRQWAEPRRLLHAGFDSRRPHRTRQPDHPRDGRAGPRPAQPQPGVPDRRGGREREAHRVVRLPRTARQRVGLGPAAP